MKDWIEQKRRKLYTIIDTEVGSLLSSKIYYTFYLLFVLLNLAATIAYTFQGARESCGEWLLRVERVTIFTFALDCAARVLTAKYEEPKMSEPRAIWEYLSSFFGIVDLLSFVPYYLEWFLPSGIVAFRLFRLFKLVHISKYHDSLSVIADVIKSKKQELQSSVLLIAILLVAASMCMYSIESQVQPEVFDNAFSGIWWAVSTLLTVGYGDIYPVTTLGQAFSICITILGVGMVAIPTGIISAGFVDQYSRIKKMNEYGLQRELQFVRAPIADKDNYEGKTIAELHFPRSLVIAAIIRGEKAIVARKQTIVHTGDILVIGALASHEGDPIELREIELTEKNPWVGEKIRELDISQQAKFVLLKRGKEIFVPNGSTEMMPGDKVLVYSQRDFPDAEILEL